ncbi:vacuolar protein sorting-associated protein 45 [Coemansia sp. RSA 989]|nr:vacuolar protein sorting-associated protein 45 [Coemansia sp. RSA 1086]KAJ1751403.1 vacuolar protein sorting-associated protein 45 [Coemansia sp. RSA 1821]KAJ1865966.1 vacuolar protein sorting-associated protein 45 [Coemansia sp. RSA 989]KAJ1873152.1 vacuolar protein sorting-associated protein 45 [Coemansia sp. RSA 990]KAJ2632344.1 vacuolar protein sorting-associated protein 45 [Coemansia sp. RSA 1290]KAJ2651838.1 vacuolar protein sorting-associated protein 45 [Coemansia sp. RSA 1250]KAJ26
MDVLKAAQHYINRIITDTSGMKVLLLDRETTPIISLVSTQSYLLSKEVFLVDRIENQQRDTMRHLKCICFVRPTNASIQALIDELRSPKYGDYYIYFANILKKSMIELLAENDENEVVREVQEFYADFYAVTPNMFHIGLVPAQHPLFGEGHSWNPGALARTVQGLSALLLSMKKRPIIRYERNSAMALKLGQELEYLMNHEANLFGTQAANTTTQLLLLDRKNDPVTPLLTHWTYHAMLHELIGINNGRIDLSHVPDARGEVKEVMISQDQDSFFKQAQFLNFGDLGVSVKEFVDSYQAKTQSHHRIESISDMKRFVEAYPEFRKLSGNVSKHVTLIGELSRLVSARHLLAVSELEQSLACNEQHSTDLKALRALIADSRILPENKVRCVLLYALRYERAPGNATAELKQLLSSHGVDADMVAMIDVVLRYGGARERQSDIFQNENIFSRGRNIFKGLQGTENVYTQHTPALAEMLEQLVRGRQIQHWQERLPALDPATTVQMPVSEMGLRNQDIIVFVIGGATLDEEMAVARLNSKLAAQNVRIVLGSTCIHNSQTFLNELSATFFP